MKNDQILMKSTACK